MKSSFQVITIFLYCALSFAQSDPTSRSWNQPVEPFRIIGNIYYVGANEITSFLITSPKGHILLDGGFVETAPQIKENIRKLGFRIEDVKYLLLSQAHSDHAGGLAQLKAWTGAKFVVSREDDVQTSRGGKGDFAWGDTMLFPAIKGDRVISDKDVVELGGVQMVAHITPGHTKGCTTWTTQIQQDGRPHNVVFVCSTTAPGYNLVRNIQYPNIVEDFRKTFRTLKVLPCDVMLGSHGSFFDLSTKSKLLAGGAHVNPFIDPAEYREYLRSSEANFEKELKRQQEQAP